MDEMLYMSDVSAKSLINQIKEKYNPKLDLIVVSTLPTTDIKSNAIYLIINGNDTIESGKSKANAYLRVSNNWVRLNTNAGLQSNNNNEIFNNYSNNTVSGTYNFVANDSNKSNGCNSAAIFGYSNTGNSASYLAMFGSGNTANVANYSIVFGNVNTVTNLGTSIIGGDSNTISGPSVNSGSVIIGRSNTVTGYTYHNAIFGENNILSATVSNCSDNLIAGSTEKVSGNRNFVTGYNNILGIFSGTNASGYIEDSIIAGGNNQINRGSFNSIFGSDNVIGSTTNSLYNFVVGQENSLNGSNSALIGQELLTTYNNTIIVGKFNLDTDNLFIIGNGTATSDRSNALWVTRSGDLYVSGTIYAENYDGIEIESITSEDLADMWAGTYVA